MARGARIECLRRRADNVAMMLGSTFVFSRFPASEESSNSTLFLSLYSASLTSISQSLLLQVKGKKSTVKFVIDCTQPVEDKVLDVASFEKYLHDRIKIGGKTGALAQNNVTISRDRTKLTVASPSDLNFSKRQLKYLSKRYLKKQQLRDYLRVVASSKMTYELRYFSISAAEDEEEEEE